MTILKILVISLLFQINHAPESAESDIRVLIDGKRVQAQRVYKMKKDDTFRFEVYGLKPGSEVSLRAKFAMVNMINDSYEVDESGTVNKIYTLPNMRFRSKCFVSYYDSKNEFHQIEFILKVR